MIKIGKVSCAGVLILYVIVGGCDRATKLPSRDHVVLPVWSQYEIRVKSKPIETSDLVDMDASCLLSMLFAVLDVYPDRSVPSVKISQK